MVREGRKIRVAKKGSNAIDEYYTIVTIFLIHRALAHVLAANITIR